MSVLKRRTQKRKRAENVVRYLCAQGLVLCPLHPHCDHRSKYEAAS